MELSGRDYSIKLVSINRSVYNPLYIFSIHMQQASLDSVHLAVDLVLQLHHWTKNHSSRDLFKQQVKLSLD